MTIGGQWQFSPSPSFLASLVLMTLVDQRVSWESRGCEVGSDRGTAKCERGRRSTGRRAEAGVYVVVLCMEEGK